MMESIHCESCLPTVECARQTPRPATVGAGNASERRSRVASDEVELIHRVAARDWQCIRYALPRLLSAAQALHRASDATTAARRRGGRRHDAGRLAQSVELRLALAPVDVDLRHCIPACSESAEGMRHAGRIRAGQVPGAHSRGAGRHAAAAGERGRASQARSRRCRFPIARCWSSATSRDAPAPKSPKSCNARSAR
jgi:hypothetical protein